MRHPNVNWNMPEDAPTWDSAKLAVLMDIRDELQKLNALLGCPNFIAIPRKLDVIIRNTTRGKVL
jgi:hypothetical protein